MNKTEEKSLGAAYYALYAYVFEGLLIVPPNLLVVLSILRYGALRREKEFILLLGQSMADGLNMLAYLTSGIYRLQKYLTGQQHRLVASHYCLIFPHLILWSFADINAMLMLVVISVDRLICVAFPLKYIRMKSGYAKKLVASCFTFTISMGALGYWLSYTQEQVEMHPIICYPSFLLQSNSLLGKAYNFYHINSPQLFSLTSICLYLLIPPIYIYQKKKLDGGISGDDLVKIERQRKVIKTFALMSICTFWVVLVPYKLAYVFWDMGFPALSWACFSFTNLNAVANLVIYRFRHFEVQLAIKGFLKSKTMPPVVSLWKKPGNPGNRS